MDKFITEIVNRIHIPSKRLSVVRNKDHFLWNKDVQRLILQESGINVVVGSPIEIRMHFELEYKQNQDRTYCYLCDDSIKLLADIRREAYEVDFVLKDMFYGYDIDAVEDIDVDVLRYLYDKQPNVRLSAIDTQLKVSEAIAIYGQKTWNEDLKEIELDWNKPIACVNAIVEIVLDVVQKGRWSEIEGEIGRINQSFQVYLKENYFTSIIPSSYILRPKMVTKILPYICSNYKHDEKVALVVIDGMSYWQYGMLRNYLKKDNINPKDDVIYSWIPSITKLSRQAIFRGGKPKYDYVQNPNNEEKLWKNYWIENGYVASEVEYIYNNINVEINGGIKRLAYVDVALDEKMHASSSYQDLYDLTDNWCEENSKYIKSLKDRGFKIYITTDHGNILAKGWRNLRTEEKTYLYQNDSRGTRHLIYNNKQGYDLFLNENRDELCNMMTHGDWIVWSDEKCFQSKPKNFTHGGSHFMEVLIPFITIE